MIGRSRRRARSPMGPGLLLGFAVSAIVGCQATQPAEEQHVWTQLMFIGTAEEAMTFYTSALPDCRIVSIDRYGSDDAQGAGGTVKEAVFSVMGQEVRCIDSPDVHKFTFTPSMSLFVNCRSVAEIDSVAAKLGEGGQVLMPLDAYPFSRRFTFIQDRYGVSWQLNLPRSESAK